MSSWWVKAFVLLIIPFTSFGNSCLPFYQSAPMYSKDTAYGLQVYKLNIDRLKLHFIVLKKNKNREFIAKQFLSSDARIVFFRLQSLSRIYEKAYKKKDEKSSDFFLKNKDFFKKFEDLIGQVDLYDGLVSMAVKLKQKSLIAYFQNKKSAAIDNLIEGFIAEDLMSPLDQKGSGIDPWDRLDQIYKDLVKFDGWKDADKDLKLHIKRLAKETRDLLGDIKNRVFTQDDIEMGLHELRRKLRWPLIHIQTLNRLTVYDENPKLPPGVQSYFDSMMAQNPKILKSGFLRMATPEIKYPIQVPLYPHAMMTEIVSAIGAQKDKAEADIYIAEAMSELKFDPRIMTQVEADLLAITKRTEKIDHKALAEDYQAQLEASGLLLYYAEQLEKLNQIEP